MPISRRTLFAFAAVAALAASLGTARAQSAAPAAAGASAVQTIQSFYGSLLAEMKAAKGLNFDQRYRLLQPAIERTFDLGLMTRIAIGPEWVNLGAAEQQDLAAAFARYTIATYASEFDGYSGERFVVDPTPASNPNGVIVESQLIQSDGKPVVLNYLMRRGVSGMWQIIDVYLSGTISELATRRSEFVAVLQRDGAKGLVRLLESRTAALRTG
jgi:phospholipid transport system substrate-binding protein